MKDYVLDSNVILNYLLGGQAASRAKDLIRSAHQREAHLAISVVNWAECRHRLTRLWNAREAEAALNAIAEIVEIVDAQRTHAELAADLKSRFRGSLADSFAAALAITRKATFVTSDPEFEPIKRELRILWLDSGKQRP